MNNPFFIKIEKIIEDEFAFNPDKIQKIDPKKLDIGLSISYDWDLEKEHFYVTLTVLYRYNINSNIIDLSKFVTTIGFAVSGLKKTIEIEDDQFNLPDFLMLTFVNTAISSARGMLAYRLSGTILANFYLPLVDPKAFLKEINLDEKIPNDKDATKQN